MAIFVRKEDKSIVETIAYTYKNEDELQELLFSCPEVIYKNSQNNELIEAETIIKIREYANIDLLLITKNSDIVIVETKLVKNPESTRHVVAQLVDYIKTIASDGMLKLIDYIKNTKNSKYFWIAKNFNIDDDGFLAALNKNIKYGNINGIIVGDDIRPNLLSLVDSIQSAPHLSFHINIVKIDSYTFENNLYVTAKNIENTNEIERSVINININSKTGEAIIESSTPSQNGQGNKPKLSWDEYINTVNISYRKIITDFKTNWQQTIDDSISMGVLGFSAGVKIGQKRIPIQFVYDTYLYLLSETSRKSNNISDEVYMIYKKEIEKVPDIYDKHLISNKVHVDFSEVDDKNLNILLNAAILCANSLKNEYKGEE